VDVRGSLKESSGKSFKEKEAENERLLHENQLLMQEIHDL
jgi:hypothetical protein